MVKAAKRSKDDIKNSVYNYLRDKDGKTVQQIMDYMIIEKLIGGNVGLTPRGLGQMLRGDGRFYSDDVARAVKIWKAHEIE